MGNIPVIRPDFRDEPQEFEELSIDEIGATLAHIYANKLHERQLL